MSAQTQTVELQWLPRDCATRHFVNKQNSKQAFLLEGLPYTFKFFWVHLKLLAHTKVSSYSSSVSPRCAFPHSWTAPLLLLIQSSQPLLLGTQTLSSNCTLIIKSLILRIFLDTSKRLYVEVRWRSSNSLRYASTIKSRYEPSQLSEFASFSFILELEGEPAAIREKLIILKDKQLLQHHQLVPGYPNSAEVINQCFLEVYQC